MNQQQNSIGCQGIEHFNRRSFLRLGGWATAGSLLTPVASTLAEAHDDGPIHQAKSLIVLW
ncbi:MAG: hypothetical protein AAGA30_16180, partial [Planctomycetota bacterium]